MLSRTARSLLLFTLGACAPATAPVTAPPPSGRAPGGTAPAITADTAPADWQHRDLATDGIPGIGSTRALRELLAGRTPGRTVVVAVLDGGVDTMHADLRANLWQNSRDIGGNRRDEDGNGYVDDLRGWNFIGGANGQNVDRDTYEITRLRARCINVEVPSSAGTPRPSDAECNRINDAFIRRRAEAEDNRQQMREVSNVWQSSIRTLRTALRTDSVTPERVRALQSSSTEVQRAKAIYLQLLSQGASEVVLRDALKAAESAVEAGLDPSFDPRPLVGDNYANATERLYGNADVQGPDPSHGTHVAGIIGAIRGNNVGVDGVAPAVRILAVRTVPDGDERDKDVANAIRYAVDQGAHIINMSFGKGYSPQKQVVDEAVRYADSRGVLMVHAAGNDGENLAERPSFPSPVYLGGGRAERWIEVGASSWKGGMNLAASFSNWGREQVDVFAPGTDILSTAPGGGYERNSGTSMAAPVVSGLAALLMAYFPNLDALSVKRIILSSARSFAGQQVTRPGGANGERVPFGSLSATGAIVDAVAAVRMAESMRAGGR